MTLLLALATPRARTALLRALAFTRRRRRRGSWMRGGLLAAAIAMTVAATAPSAHAASAVESGDTLSYQAGLGESNRVTVQVDAFAVTIEDPGATITPGGTCRRTDVTNVNKVRCDDPSNLEQVRVIVGDRADSIDVNDFSGVIVERYTLSGGTDSDTLDTRGAQVREFAALLGDDGNDTLIGGFGREVLFGGPGADVMNGGDGFDTAAYAERNASQPVFVDFDGVADDGNAGLDGVSTVSDVRAGADNVMPDIEGSSGGGGNDRLIGNARANTLTGNAGNDILDGRAGGDTLQGGLGADAITGGDGRDTVTYAERGAAQPVKVDLDGVADDGENGGTEGDDAGGGGVERIIGGAGGDQLTGNTVANDIIGGAGDDVSLGGLGGADFLAGEAGNDNLLGQNGSDTMQGGPGADAMSGGDGVDTVSYEDRKAESVGLTVDLDGVADDGSAGEGDNAGAGVEDIVGGAGDDTLTGNANANRLVGGGRNDSLFGLGGDDVLNSNDGLLDQVFCGAGTDKGVVDLKDGPPGFPDCEAVEQAAVDQHPAVRIRRRAQLLLAHQPRLRARLRCPRKRRGGCNGKLRAALKRKQLRGALKDGQPVLTGRRFRRIRRGDRRVVSLRLSQSGVRALARRERVWFEALDRDRRGQPRRAIRLAKLKVVRGARG